MMPNIRLKVEEMIRYINNNSYTKDGEIVLDEGSYTYKGIKVTIERAKNG